MLTVNCGFAGRVHVTKHTGDGVGERITVENTFLPSYLESISGNETASGAQFPDYIRYGQGVHTDLSVVTDLENPIGNVRTADNTLGGPTTIVGDVRVAHRYVRAQINPRGVPWTLSEVGLRRGTGTGVVSYVEVLKDGEHIQVLENEYVQLEYEYQVHYPVKVVQVVDVAGTPTTAEFFTGQFSISSSNLVGTSAVGGTHLYSAPNRGSPQTSANFGLHGASENIANWPAGVAGVGRGTGGNLYHCNFTPYIPKTNLDTLKVTIIWNFQNATYIPLS